MKRNRPGAYPGRIFVGVNKLFRERFFRNRPRERTKNHKAYRHRRTQHDHSHVLRNRQSSVAEHGTQQPEARAARAQREINAFSHTTRHSHQPGKYGGNYQVDSDQNKIANRSAPMNNPAFRRKKSMRSDSQKHERMDECDQGPLAIGKNPKVIHNNAFSLSDLRNGRCDLADLKL